jgi:hypothetical protein
MSSCARLAGGRASQTSESILMDTVTPGSPDYLQLTFIDFFFRIFEIFMNIFVGLASMFLTDITKAVFGVP